MKMIHSYNLRRAQRVANDENGVLQSPPQSLATPVRKRVKKSTAIQRKRVATKKARSNDSTSSRASDSEESNIQTEVIGKPVSNQRAKKIRLRKAATEANDRTANDTVLSAESRECSIHESEEPNENDHVNGTIKVPSPEGGKESSAKGRNGATRKQSPSTNNTNIQLNGEDVEMEHGSEQIVPQTNAGLFNNFARLTPPQKLISPSQKVPSSTQKVTPSPQKVVSPSQKIVTPVQKVITPPQKVNTPPKATSPSTNATPGQPILLQSESRKRQIPFTQLQQAQGGSPMKSKTKRHRILQEHITNPETNPLLERLRSAKRKRTEGDDKNDEDDLSDAPEPKKRTARWSFKPNSEGNLTLVSRNNIDPDDPSIVFMEQSEAANLISQEFERKKQVRFADRIAKQHSELTEEEKAIHQAKLGEQNLQVTTHGLLGDSLSRNGDMRILARKLDAGNKTMLERIESLTSSNDEELRESFAKDLMELASAIRTAGPQSKSISPVDKVESMQMEVIQDNKENASASTSPEQVPLQIEAPPAPVELVKTPGRIYASIRKLRSYLPFGSTTLDSGQGSSPIKVGNVSRPPDSPTPAPRAGGPAAKSNNSIAKVPAIKPSRKVLDQDLRQKGNLNATKPEISLTTKPGTGSRSYSGIVKSKRSPVKEPQPFKRMTSDELIKAMQENWNSGTLTPAYKPYKKPVPKTPVPKQPAIVSLIPTTPTSQRRKIGSEAYPLTADGKIPGPAPNAYGLNEDYFYNAESSTDSEEEERIVKRRRVYPSVILARSKVNITRLTKSAPRPAVTRPRFHTPGPRTNTAGDVDPLDSDESNEETLKVSSTERREKQRVKVQAERLQHARDAHRPKTPSRLRQITTIPNSPIRVEKRVKKKSRGKGTRGTLRVFAHV